VVVTTRPVRGKGGGGGDVAGPWGLSCGSSLELWADLPSFVLDRTCSRSSPQPPAQLALTWSSLAPALARLRSFVLVGALLCLVLGVVGQHALVRAKSGSFALGCTRLYLIGLASSCMRSFALAWACVG
jgi:hypothetical protein